MTLIAYTDGLVERRDEDLDVGIHRLANSIQQSADASAEQLLTQLLHPMVNGTDTAEDIALWPSNGPTNRQRSLLDRTQVRVDIVEMSKGRNADGSTVLVLAGEVDLAVAEKIRDAGVAALTEDDSVALRIDLSAVTFMDSSGLGALIQVNNAAPDRVVLVAPSPRTRRLLEIAGLTSTFTFETTSDPTKTG